MPDSPGLRVPLRDAAGSGAVVDELMFVQRPVREDPRHVIRPHEPPDRFGPGGAVEVQAGHPVRVAAAVRDPGDPRHGVLQVVRDDKVVVHRAVARVLLRGDNNSSH